MIVIYSQQKVYWAEVEKKKGLSAHPNCLRIWNTSKDLKGLIDICFLSIWSRVKDQLTLSLPCKSRRVFNFSNSREVPGSLTVPLWPRCTIDELKAGSWAVNNNTHTSPHTHSCRDTHAHVCRHILTSFVWIHSWIIDPDTHIQRPPSCTHTDFKCFTGIHCWIIH